MMSTKEVKLGVLANVALVVIKVVDDSAGWEKYGITVFSME